MRTKLTIILVALIYLTQQNANAQVWLGIYGMRTSSTNSLTSPDVGGGFAMSFLSVAKDVSKLGSSNVVPKNAERSATKIADQTNSLQVQVGANFLYSGLGHRNFNNVPLSSQAGLAKVNISNAMWSMNLLGRISYKNQSIFTPYADVFIGYRGISSNLTVTPYMQYTNYTKETTQPLSSLSGLNYGIGGGVTTNLSKRVKLDLGISYLKAVQNGHVADLNSAYSDQSGINLNLKNAPNGLLMVNVGLLFYLESDGTSDNCNCRHSRSGGGVRWGGGGWGHTGGGGTPGRVNVHIGGGGRPW